MMKSYNYLKFKNKEYDLIHSSGIQSGDQIPDFSFLTLDGQTKSISDYFNKPIILETGSITCGMFAGQGDSMNMLAKENTDYNFLVLYVREAHPGKLIKAHTTQAEKCDLAKRLHKEDIVENRTIIIDDIEGSVHKMLGALPNMIFIINTNGQVIFKEEWNNAKSLQNAILQYKTNKKIKNKKWAMLPLPNIPVEYRVFKRAGWDAGIDFILALPKLVFSHFLGGLCSRFPQKSMHRYTNSINKLNYCRLQKKH